MRASCQPDEAQFHDRCVLCTAALANYLGRPFSPLLASELERVQREAIYQNRVFFVRNLGFVTPTEARRITFEETVRFEQIHEEIYREFGFELISVKECGRAGQHNQSSNSVTLSGLAHRPLTEHRDIEIVQPGWKPAQRASGRPLGTGPSGRDRKPYAVSIMVTSACKRRT
jgi:hypothetical protein